MADNDIAHLIQVIYEKYNESQNGKKSEERIYMTEDAFRANLKAKVKESPIEDKILLYNEIYRNIKEDSLEIDSKGNVVISAKLITTVENVIKTKQEESARTSENVSNKKENIILSQEEFDKLSPEEKSERALSSLSAITGWSESDTKKFMSFVFETDFSKYDGASKVADGMREENSETTETVKKYVEGVIGANHLNQNGQQIAVYTFEAIEILKKSPYGKLFGIDENTVALDDKKGYIESLFGVLFAGKKSLNELTENEIERFFRGMNLQDVYKSIPGGFNLDDFLAYLNDLKDVLGLCEFIQDDKNADILNMATPEMAQKLNGQNKFFTSRYVKWNNFDKDNDLLQASSYATVYQDLMTLAQGRQEMEEQYHGIGTSYIQNEDRDEVILLPEQIKQLLNGYREILSPDVYKGVESLLSSLPYSKFDIKTITEFIRENSEQYGLNNDEIGKVLRGIQGVQSVEELGNVEDFRNVGKDYTYLLGQKQKGNIAKGVLDVIEGYKASKGTTLKLEDVLRAKQTVEEPEITEDVVEMESDFEAELAAISDMQPDMFAGMFESMAEEMVFDVEQPVVETEKKEQTVPEIDSTEERSDNPIPQDKGVQITDSTVEDNMVQGIQIEDIAVDENLINTMNNENLPKKITWVDKVRASVDAFGKNVKKAFGSFISAITGKGGENNSGANNSTSSTSSNAGQNKPVQEFSNFVPTVELNLKQAQQATKAAEEAKKNNDARGTDEPTQDDSEIGE